MQQQQTEQLEMIKQNSKNKNIIYFMIFWPWLIICHINKKAKIKDANISEVI